MDKLKKLPLMVEMTLQLKVVKKVKIHSKNL
jgi:hypothetical protein